MLQTNNTCATSSKIDLQKKRLDSYKKKKKAKKNVKKRKTKKLWNFDEKLQCLLILLLKQVKHYNDLQRYSHVSINTYIYSHISTLETTWKNPCHMLLKDPKKISNAVYCRWYSQYILAFDKFP